MNDALLAFGAALAASLGLTPLVRGLARRTRFVAAPRPDRWHKKPTALLGGVAIYAAFLLVYLWTRPAALAGDALLVVCSSAMFLLGLVDDALRLKPYAKLIAQIAAATVLTMYGLALPWTPNPVLNQGITIFWLIGITNALNLLDNMDGLAAGIAFIGAAFLVVFFVGSGQLAAARMTAAFAGAILGFLVFNFNPASIFMGDSGSLFVGFFLGGVSLVSTQFRSRNVMAVLAAPVMLLLIPIVDTTLVTVMRKVYGRPVSQGGRDHTSHRLVALGLSERAAVVTLYVIATVSGLVGVGLRSVATPVAIAVVPLFTIAIVLGAIVLGKVKVYEGVDDPAKAAGRALVPTLADFAYKRRVFEVLYDLVAILMAYYLAFLLRFEGALTADYWSQFLRSIAPVVVAQMSVFLAAGMYRGLWRYTGIDDLMLFSRGTAAATVLSTAVLAVAFRYEHFSRAVPILDAMLLFLFVAGGRVFFRVVRNWIVQTVRKEGRRALIYGAGDGGELLLRELQQNRSLGLLPVGFVDDDPMKRGKVIHGVRVVGAGDEIEELLPLLGVETLVLSTTKLDPARRERLEALCRDRAIAYRTLRLTLE